MRFVSGSNFARIEKHTDGSFFVFSHYHKDATVILHKRYFQGLNWLLENNSLFKNA